MRSKTVYDREFKLQVVRQLASGEKRFAQLCREHGLGSSLLCRWREQYEHHGEQAWLPKESATSSTAPSTAPDAEVRAAEARIAALEGALGRAHMEIDFLRQCVRTLEKGGSLPPRNGR